MRCAILRRGVRPSHEEANCSFTHPVSLVVPWGRNLCMDIVAEIVITVQRLGGGSRTNTHSRGVMCLWLRDGLLPLITPPEMIPCSEKVIGDGVVEGVHEQLLGVRLAVSDERGAFPGFPLCKIVSKPPVAPEGVLS